MPIVLLFGLFVPRVLFVFLYIFSEWFTGVVDSWFWLLLGFIFMPYTILWYSVVVNWYGGEWGIWQTTVLVFTIVTDLTSGAKLKSGK